MGKTKTGPKVNGRRMKAGTQFVKKGMGYADWVAGAVDWEDVGWGGVEKVGMSANQGEDVGTDEVEVKKCEGCRVRNRVCVGRYGQGWEEEIGRQEEGLSAEGRSRLVRKGEQDNDEGPESREGYGKCEYAGDGESNEERKSDRQRKRGKDTPDCRGHTKYWSRSSKKILTGKRKAWRTRGREATDRTRRQENGNSGFGMISAPHGLERGDAGTPRAQSRAKKRRDPASHKPDCRCVICEQRRRKGAAFMPSALPLDGHSTDAAILKACRAFQLECGRGTEDGEEKGAKIPVSESFPSFDQDFRVMREGAWEGWPGVDMGGQGEDYGAAGMDREAEDLIEGSGLAGNGPDCRDRAGGYPMEARRGERYTPHGEGGGDGSLAAAVADVIRGANDEDDDDSPDGGDVGGGDRQVAAEGRRRVAGEGAVVGVAGLGDELDRTGEEGINANYEGDGRVELAQARVDVQHQDARIDEAGKRKQPENWAEVGKRDEEELSEEEVEEEEVEEEEVEEEEVEEMEEEEESYVHGGQGQGLTSRAVMKVGADVGGVEGDVGSGGLSFGVVPYKVRADCGFSVVGRARQAVARTLGARQKGKRGSGRSAKVPSIGKRGGGVQNHKPECPCIVCKQARVKMKRMKEEGMKGGATPLPSPSPAAMFQARMPKKKLKLAAPHCGSIRERRGAGEKRDGVGRGRGREGVMERVDGGGVDCEKNEGVGERKRGREGEFGDTEGQRTRRRLENMNGIRRGGIGVGGGGGGARELAGEEWDEDGHGRRSNETEESEGADRGDSHGGDAVQRVDDDGEEEDDEEDDEEDGEEDDEEEDEDDEDDEDEDDEDDVEEEGAGVHGGEEGEEGGNNQYDDQEEEIGDEHDKGNGEMRGKKKLKSFGDCEVPGGRVSNREREAGAAFTNPSSSGPRKRVVRVSSAVLAIPREYELYREDRGQHPDGRRYRHFIVRTREGKEQLAATAVAASPSSTFIYTTSPNFGSFTFKSSREAAVWLGARIRGRPVDGVRKRLFRGPGGEKLSKKRPLKKRLATADGSGNTGRQQFGEGNVRSLDRRVNHSEDASRSNPEGNQRQVIGTEVGEQTDMSQTLAHIVTYLTFLEEKIDRQQNQLDEIIVGLRTIANIVKGKNQIQGEEEQEEKKEKKVVKKLMGDAIKSAGPVIKTNGNGSNGNGSSQPSTPHSSHSSKSTPKETPEKTSAEPEKPKKKEKVKMKLPFTFCNKKEESLLLWIAEIQTYVSTAPVEPESQVTFTTSCMGGEAKEWVLVEANVAGFEDIGEWAKTLTPGLNLQDSQVLYNYSRALPEPIRGHLVTEAKSGKYNYRQFRDLALQREQMTFQVKNSYAAVVKSGVGGGRQYNGKRVLCRQKRQDHTLVVFDDDTVEKWPNEENDNNSDSGKGEVTAVVANKGGPPRTGGKKQRAFPWHPGIADGKPWVEMGMTRKTWQERMDNAQCLKCDTAGHVIAYCPQIRNPKANSQ
ncbi:hypothetical protein CBR_g19404 [Chara braunii]|uniref:Uncharacterized protein n=1 Tax=Chara braunii TaxID=69332 RepID=A0A388KXX4_CHABU|nr:hypothetical protein CBR_g19404 [Chara braunii]|eukprot:GBG74891.1 hypothetical protein CBR_g19404 [Chara braunii]